MLQSESGTMDIFNGLLAEMSWDSPNPLFACLTAVILFVTASKRKRFTFPYLASTAFGAVGFLLSGWVGLLTFGIAIAYRMTRRMRPMPRGIAIVVLGMAVFTIAGWFVHQAEPRTIGHAAATDGFLGWLAAATADAGNNPVAAWIIIVFWITVFTIVYLAIRWKRNTPYRNMGLGVSKEHMYLGIVNKNLVPVPEDQRDPKRAFAAADRVSKLHDQHGLCAYQLTVQGHPQWEPYRLGIQWEGDHVVPHALGGATNYVNLQVLCADCNSAKSNKFGPAAIAAIVQRWTIASQR